MTFFSVIVPTYNRARLIRRTIDSVVAQNFEDWELIIVDDGSTDDTEAVVRSFDSEKIRYFKKVNEERGAARNYGLEQARGKYVNFFDSDDLMYPQHLEQAYRYLRKSSPPRVLCFPFEYLDSKGNHLFTRKGFEGRLNERILETNFISVNSAFIARDLLIDDLRFSSDRKFRVAEDWYFFIRLSMECEIQGVQEATHAYFVHEENTMSQISSEDYKIAFGYFENLFASEYSSNPSAIRSVKSEFLSMMALTFALEKKPSTAIKYLLNSFIQKPSKVFRKRTLGILKNLM